MRGGAVRMSVDGAQTTSGHALRVRMRHERAGLRGQALLEFALFFLFIMLLLAGVTDIAGLLDLHLAVVYAARQGARTGVVMGSQPSADCPIVGAIHAGMSNQPNSTLTLIEIYQSDAYGHPTGSVEYYPGTVDCRGGQIINTATGLVQAPLPGSNWDPSLRNVTPFFEDSLGVALTFTYQMQFDLVGSSVSATDYAVYPMNPLAAPTVTIGATAVS